GLSVHGRREAGRSTRTVARYQGGPDHPGRRDHAGAGVLSGQLRTQPLGPDQRPGVRAARPGSGDRRGAGGAVMITVYVPRDSAATSVGANEVAVALAREAAVTGRQIRLVRNGTRGMLWLEPLVEVDTAAGRIGYGPIRPEDVGDLVAAGMLEGVPNDVCLGVVEDLPWMRDQQRLCLARVGVTDPLSPND